MLKGRGWSEIVVWVSNRQGDNGLHHHYFWNTEPPEGHITKPVSSVFYIWVCRFDNGCYSVWEQTLSHSLGSETHTIQPNFKASRTPNKCFIWNHHKSSIRIEILQNFQICLHVSNWTLGMTFKGDITV